jgi:hypothetical protein
MLEVIKIPDGMGLEGDLFFYRMDSCNDEGEEICFIAGEEELGQYAGDTHNWDDGEPKTYTFKGDLNALFDLMKAKCEPDKSSQWLNDLV